MSYDDFITSVVLEEDVKENTKKKKKWICDVIFKEYKNFSFFRKDLSELIFNKH